jgi:hypothetical protein
MPAVTALVASAAAAVIAALLTKRHGWTHGKVMASDWLMYSEQLHCECAASERASSSAILVESSCVVAVTRLVMLLP